MSRELQNLFRGEPPKNPNSPHCNFFKRIIYDAKQEDLTEERLNLECENFISDLYRVKEHVIKLIKIKSECEHLEFSSPCDYTFQRRVVGYLHVYERRCLNCGYLQNYSYPYGGLALAKPDWTNNSIQRYHNNDI
jgi:hypothetical protein